MCLDTMPALDGRTGTRTDRQTDGRTELVKIIALCMHCMLTRDKNGLHLPKLSLNLKWRSFWLRNQFFVTGSYDMYYYFYYRAIACLCMHSALWLWQFCSSVCLSVCLSVPLWYCIETYAHIGKLFPPSGSGMTSFFQTYRRYKTTRMDPSAVALNTRWWEKLRLST